MATDGSVIRVLIVDDHAVVRSGLGTFLMVHEDLVKVGEASDGVEALRLCEALQPDVVLMDLVMPLQDGATTTKLIRERWPDIQVIVLTSFKEEALVRDALEAGAIAYLLKDVSADELATAIRFAHAGRPTLAPEAAEVLIRTTVRRSEVGDNLTEREREILKLMAEGLSNPDIAGRLRVSRSTVKFHVSNILSKLQADTRTEAVATAFQQELL